MDIFYDYQSIFRQRLGGVSRYHSELYRRISVNKNVRAFCKIYGSPNIYFEDILGYKSYDKYGYNWWFFNKANRIANFFNIRCKRYDVIHPTWYSPKAYYESSKAKYVITIHDMIHEIYRGDLVSEIEGKKFWIYNSDEIIAVSNNTKKDILSFYPDIDAQKITVIPLGVDKDIIPKMPKCILPKKYILYVGGRGYEYKNFMRFLKVATKILSDCKDVDLLIVGGDELRGDERDIVSQFDLEERVHIVHVDDEELAYVYSCAECFVYPSLYEGFGIPILEAFVNKCPVVCSDASSFPEVAGDAAVYFNPVSEEDMYEKICCVINDLELREKMINKGSEQLEKFSWDTMAKKTLEVYQK